MIPPIGSKLIATHTRVIYDIVSNQPYMNYGIGIERIRNGNGETEYIKSSDIGTEFLLIEE